MSMSSDGSKVVATATYPSKSGYGEVVYSSDYGASFTVLQGLNDQTASAISNFGTGLLTASSQGYVYYVDYYSSSIVTQTTLGKSNWAAIWCSPIDGSIKYAVQSKSSTQGLAYFQYSYTTANPTLAPTTATPTSIPTANPTPTYSPTKSGEDVWTQSGTIAKWSSISSSESGNVVAVTSDGSFYYSDD